jgi:hypothetical protein
MINYFKSYTPIKCWLCNKDCIPTIHNSEFNFNFECNNNLLINQERCYNFSIRANVTATIGLCNIIDFGTEFEITQISLFKIKDIVYTKVIHFSGVERDLLYEEEMSFIKFINLDYKDYFLNIINKCRNNLLFL